MRRIISDVIMGCHGLQIKYTIRKSIWPLWNKPLKDIYLAFGDAKTEAAVYNYFLSRMYSEGVSLKRSRKSVLK